MKINKYIEIVGAKKSRLNAMSKSSREHILTILEKRYTHVAISAIDTMQDLEDLVAKKPDLVILGMKVLLLKPELGYDDSPKMWLSDYLAENGINFTGSETNALWLEYNKPIAKQHILSAGLQSSAYFISTAREPIFDHSLDFPLFVKPANSGGSKGVDKHSVVQNHAELEAKIVSIHDDHDSDALVEEYLSGREFSVAIIDNESTGNLMAMPIEILSPKDTSGYSFLSAEVKKADSEKTVAVTDSVLKMTINDFAIDVFRSLGARDYGRIDVRLDAFGAPNFIEANLMPGLSNHGYLSRCFFINEQLGYEDMIFSIVNLGLKRSVHITPLTLVASAREFMHAVTPELTNTPA